MEKRLLLTFVISLGIVGLWQFLLPKPPPPAHTVPPTAESVPPSALRHTPSTLRLAEEAAMA